MTSLGAYRIAPYRAEQRDGIARLQQDLWRGDDATNAAYLDWKYRRGPAPEQSFLLVVLHGEQVVGMRGEIAMRWEGGVPRREFLAANSADLLIDPRHRDRGLNRELASALADALIERGLPYSFGWSAGPRPLEWLKRIGWHEVGSLDARWTEPATPLSRAAHRAARATGLDRVPWFAPRYQHLRPVAERAPAAALARVPDTTVRTPRGLVTVASHPRPEAIAGLVERLGHDGRLRQVRDDRWFAWRFEDPLACNRFVFADSDRLEGYLVVQARSHRSVDHLAIVDLEASEPVHLEDMLGVAARRLAVDRFVVWGATQREATLRALVRAGFHPMPRPGSPAEPRAALLALRLPAANALSSTLVDRSPEALVDWDVRMAYSDAF